jgi:hypothetical protein
MVQTCHQGSTIPTFSASLQGARMREAQLNAESAVRGWGNPDFKQADDAITGLDVLSVQIRAGNIPPGHVAFIDPWQN